MVTAEGVRIVDAGAVWSNQAQWKGGGETWLFAELRSGLSISLGRFCARPTVDIRRRFPGLGRIRI